MRPWSCPAAAGRGGVLPAPLSRARTVAAALLCVVAVAGVFRCRHLDYGGFSADEINKLEAVRGYSRGEWSGNAEHPMLMKLAMWASLSASGAWNGWAARHGAATVSPEAALRLPNAVVGAATVVPLFLLARSLFGPLVAWWAAVLLALDVSITGVNRIGKEDTFVVFFLLLAAWLYEVARERHLRAGRVPHAWYGASGAAFGLMLASKYAPQHLGIWALFSMAAAAESRRAAAAEGVPDESWQRASPWFYVMIGAAFVAGNPAILLPSTWRYLVDFFLGGHGILHHGAYFAGRVYPNMPGDTVFGLPWHFYLTYVLTKTPLAVLAAVALGLGELVRRRRERGAVFARVFLIFLLVPASLIAGKYIRYVLPALVVLDLVAALGVVRVVDLAGRLRRPALRACATAGVVLLAAGAPALAQVRWSPLPSVYQNAIGRRLSTPGAMFPNDEIYDVGVRESVAWIARRAAPGASIASDAPGVVREYLRRFGRVDIEARFLSMQGIGRPPAEAWVLVQNSHACFENIQMFEQLRRRPPAFVYRVHGTAAVETYRMSW